MTENMSAVRRLPLPLFKKIKLDSFKTNNVSSCGIIILGNCEQATHVTYFAHMGSQSDLNVQHLSIDLRLASQSHNKIAEHYDQVKPALLIPLLVW